jgi:hypothetical protein
VRLGENDELRVPEPACVIVGDSVWLALELREGLCVRLGEVEPLGVSVTLPVPLLLPVAVPEREPVAVAVSVNDGVGL